MQLRRKIFDGQIGRLSYGAPVSDRRASVLSAVHNAVVSRAAAGKGRARELDQQPAGTKEHQCLRRIQATSAALAQGPKVNFSQPPRWPRAPAVMQWSQKGYHVARLRFELESSMRRRGDPYSACVPPPPQCHNQAIAHDHQG